MNIRGFVFFLFKPTIMLVVFLSFLVFSPSISAQQPQRLIYMVQDIGGSGSHSRFATIDPVTREVAFLGPFYPHWNIETLDIHPTTGVIYTIPADNGIGTTGRLYTLDPDTGMLNYIGNTGENDIAALAFHPDGTLWGVRRRDHIFTVNLNTAQITKVKTGIDDFEGAAWDIDGKYLYLTMEKSSALYRYDKDTKTISVYDTNAFPDEVEALDFLPDNTLLAGTDRHASRHLIRYDVTTRSVVEVLITNDSDLNDIEGISWWEGHGNLSFNECSISLSAISPMAPGTSRDIQVTIHNGDMAQIEYKSSDSNVLYFDPPQSTNLTSTTSPFIVDLHAGVSGNAQISATATTTSGDVCNSNTVSVEIIGQPAWWQIVNGNVFSGTTNTSGGRIQSIVPSGSFFIEKTGPNSIGLPIYSSNLMVNPDRISSFAWNAGSNIDPKFVVYSYNRIFSLASTATNYINQSVGNDPGAQYFSNSCTGSDFCWYKTISNLQLKEESLDESKLVVFVNGSLTVNNNLSFDDGKGNAIFVASGDIIVKPSVTDLEGIYMANGRFITEPSTNQLNVEGMVYSREAPSLQREIPPNSLPAEKFIFRPDIVFNLPRIFTKREIVSWSEVLP